ncbi:hypothetical protein FKP32DRAFT_1592866 [Trametes sanguinea]|nr:hypothetical protein FKP32DRAFT_1592866 [Trametes sanguinea]
MLSQLQIGSEYRCLLARVSPRPLGHGTPYDMWRQLLDCGTAGPERLIRNNLVIAASERAIPSTELPLELGCLLQEGEGHDATTREGWNLLSTRERTLQTYRLTQVSQHHDARSLMSGTICGTLRATMPTAFCQSGHPGQAWVKLNAFQWDVAHQNHCLSSL